MNGMHDMGGMHGFGPIQPRSNEEQFHAEWEQIQFDLGLIGGGSRFDRSAYTQTPWGGEV